MRQKIVFTADTSDECWVQFNEYFKGKKHLVTDIVRYNTTKNNLLNWYKKRLNKKELIVIYNANE